MKTWQNPEDLPRSGGIVQNAFTGHLHLIFVLDISGSMSDLTSTGESKIQQLTNCLNGLIRGIREIPAVSAATDISVITFEEEANILQPANPLDNCDFFDVSEFHCYGGTNGWAGLDLALAEYEKRKEEYKRMSVARYPAQIVYMSDGHNNFGSDRNGVVADFRRLQQPQGSRNKPKVTLIPIGFGSDADHGFLRSLNIDGGDIPASDSSSGITLEMIFKYLTASCVYMGSSDPADPANLPNPAQIMDYLNQQRQATL